jgi:hypothetical protein
MFSDGSVRTRGDHEAIDVESTDDNLVGDERCGILRHLANRPSSGATVDAAR